MREEKRPWGLRADLAQALEDGAHEKLGVEELRLLRGSPERFEESIVIVGKSRRVHVHHGDHLDEAASAARGLVTKDEGLLLLEVHVLHDLCESTGVERAAKRGKSSVRAVK